MISVAVIYGGRSKEREVSIKSGKGIANALRAKGYEVKEIDYKSKDFISELSDIDVVYIALHGKYGEDGRIQGLLDILDIPYVGSGVFASALAMNKYKAKTIFKSAGIRVAKDYLLQKDSDIETAVSNIEDNFNYPLVVKPNEEGSTIGFSIVNNKVELEEAIKFAFTFDKQIIIEEFIQGREVTIAVMETIDDIKALPVVEIVPIKNKYYDYESKYAPGGSDHIVPARIDSKTEEVLKNWAVEAHKQLGCETLSRVDFIIPDEGLPFILEVNTLPGMTETSLYPDAAKAIGLDYKDIVSNFVDLTFKKYKNNN